MTSFFDWKRGVLPKLAVPTHNSVGSFMVGLEKSETALWLATA